MANPLYGQNKADANIDAVTANYLDFLAGNQENLGLGKAVGDTEADAVVAGGATAAEILATTLIPNAVNSCAHDTNAAGAVYLPPATKDTHLVLEITGDMDEANAFTIFARGAVDAGTSVVFSKAVVGGLFSGAATSSVEMLGTAAAPTSIKLIYTPAAADTNFLGAGSMIHFYAPKDDRWLVRIENVPEGTGATGALTTSAS